MQFYIATNHCIPHTHPPHPTRAEVMVYTLCFLRDSLLGGISKEETFSEQESECPSCSWPGVLHDRGEV